MTSTAPTRGTEHLRHLHCERADASRRAVDQEPGPRPDLADVADGDERGERWTRWGTCTARTTGVPALRDRGRLLEADGVRYEHGNQTRRELADGSAWAYAWNGSGMLSEVTRPDGERVRFEYDAFARRTAKRVVQVGEDSTETVQAEHRFVWDGHTVLHELDSEAGLMVERGMIDSPGDDFYSTSRSGLTPLSDTDWRRYLDSVGDDVDRVVADLDRFHNTWLPDAVAQGHYPLISPDDITALQDSYRSEKLRVFGCT